MDKEKPIEHPIEYLKAHCDIVNNAREKLREELKKMEPTSANEHENAKLSMRPDFSKSSNEWYAPLYSWVLENRKRYFIISFNRINEREVSLESIRGVEEVTEKMEKTLV